MGSSAQIMDSMEADLAHLAGAVWRGAAPENDDDGWGDENDTSRSNSLPVPQLSIAPVAPLTDSGEVVVSVQVPDSSSREGPVDVVCVVDVSASMSMPAATEDMGVQDDLTILDIVKHAVNTLMHTLHESDRFSIIAFGDSAITAHKLTTMDPTNLAAAEQALNSLKPLGQTNLWAGMEAALAELDSEPSDRLKVMMVLTDGKPNVNPPDGNLQALINYKDSHPGLSVQINTFGFGYDLDSELLLQLSSECGGTFAFIPDAPIVGTTFVDSLANVLSTRTLTAELHLTPAEGVQFEGNTPSGCTEAPWGRVYHLGPLSLNQNRQIAASISGIPADSSLPYLEATLKYADPSGSPVTVTADGYRRQSNVILYHNALGGSLRSSVVQAGHSALQKAANGAHDEASADMAAAVELVANMLPNVKGEACEAGLKALHADASGRMTKALQGADRFDRWGKHFLRAITRAHELQLCTNFMDAGLQGYGGQLFAHLRTRGNQVFRGLPPPQPEAAVSTVDEALADMGLTVATAPAGLVQMIREQLQAAAPAPAPAVHTTTTTLQRQDSEGMDRYMDQGGG